MVRRISWGKSAYTTIRILILIVLSGPLLAQEESEYKSAISDLLDMEVDSESLLGFKDIEADVLENATDYEKTYFYFARSSREEYSGLLENAFQSIAKGEKYQAKLPVDSSWYWLQLYRLQTLGNIYLSLEQYDKALERYNEAREICDEQGFSYQGLLTNLASSYSLNGQNEEAIEVLRHGIKHYTAVGYTIGIIDMYYNLGVLKLREKEYAQARIFADSAYGLALSIDDYYTFGLQLILQADLAFIEKDLQKSAEFYSRAEAVYDSLGLLRTQAYITRKLASLYQEMGDLENALEIFRLTAKLEDSATSREYADEVSRQQVAFETREKENQLRINQLELENERQEKEAALTTRNYLLLAIFLVLIISLFVIRMYGQRQKLARQQMEISKRKVDDLIKRQEIEVLDALSDGQDRERKRLARDLHDRMGSLLVSIKMQMDSMRNHAAPAFLAKLNESGNLIKEAITEVRRISHNLSSQNITEFGLVAALEGLKKTIEQTGKVKINIDAVGLKSRLPINKEVEIYRIIQEIASNALKHAGASEINITLSRDTEEFNLMVEDDGRGFDTNQKFTGIGLRNMQSRATDLGGELHIDSKPGSGTTVILNLPLNNETEVAA